MRAIRGVLALVVLLLLGACATGPKFAEVAPTFTTLSPENGRIYFYRVAAMGAAVQPEIKVNGDVVGKAQARGFFYIDRAPGNYEVVTSTEVERKLTLTLEQGQTRYVRLGISIGFFVGHVFPELVDTDVGAKEIQECSYTGSTVAKK